MCLMGYTKSRTNRIPRAHVEEGMRVNDDGWGIMYVDPETMRVVTHKGLGKPEEFEAAYRNIPETFSGHAFHFRYGTSGGKTIEMAHPFKVLDADEDGGLDIYMMHNGVLDSSYYRRSDKDRSDTAQFVDDFLKPILQRDPYMLRNQGFQQMLSAMLGNPNKFLFLDSEGVFTTINEYQGEWFGGFWYSNSGYKRYTYAGFTGKAGKGPGHFRSHGDMLDGYDDYYGSWDKWREKDAASSAVIQASTTTGSTQLASVEVTVTDAKDDKVRSDIAHPYAFPPDPKPQEVAASCPVPQTTKTVTGVEDADDDEEEEVDEREIEDMILSPNMLRGMSYEEIEELVVDHPGAVVDMLYVEFTDEGWMLERDQNRAAAGGTR